MSESTTPPRLHFVTGKLAAESLRRQLESLAPAAGFTASLQVLPITVAALMTTDWVARHIEVPAGTDRVLLPGYCLGDLESLAARLGVGVERGPRDLAELPEHFACAASSREGYGEYDIEIIAEINHAPRLSLAEMLTEAARLRADGADWIDVGCDPGGTWQGVGECVRALRDAGHRVSIDSFEPREIEAAARAGAELVLSVNATNRDAAADWGVEVVAIPDDPHSLEGLDETAERLAAANVPYRLDPILEPLGFGLAASLARYFEVRRRHPDAPMMMGIGNLTELTEVDSAGINMLLLGLCQELRIGSVLTTQVINWARSSVRECDVARRLAHFAVTRQRLPKHVDPRLVMLRDPRLHPPTAEELATLAEQLRDRNFRLFADEQRLHLLAAGLRLSHADPFELFASLCRSGTDGSVPRNLDLAHAFYLGYELCKASTARALGKQYRQDEALDWGLLTTPETSHRGPQANGERAEGDVDV